MRRAVALLAAALLLAGAAGCGEDGAEPGVPKGATLVLDFTPNAVHTGIYAALAQGFYDDEGVDLEDPASRANRPTRRSCSPPAASTSRSSTSTTSGSPASAASTWSGVMPIVQRPLAAVIARGDGPVRRPRDLEGHTVGVTGLPSDEAVVDSEVSADGGDPAAVERVTIGFNAVSSLAAGKVDAATGFWNAEGVALRQPGRPDPRSSRSTATAPRPTPSWSSPPPARPSKSDPELVDAVVAATRRGYAFAERTRAGPRRPARRQPGARPRRTAGPAATPCSPTSTRALRPAVLRAWAAWDLEARPARDPLDVAERSTWAERGVASPDTAARRVSGEVCRRSALEQPL